MHIPDGFLDVKVWAPATIAGAAVVYYALKKTSDDLAGKQVPLVSLVGAFIFAAQMINFPISGATSGHFLGGALAAILFGPWISTLIMAAVLIIQAIVFQDGGITVIGANVLCTGVIGSFVGYGVYRSLRHLFAGRYLTVIVFFAAWLSIVAASLGVASLLALSGTLDLKTAIYAMSGWHSLIGVGEGLITAAVIRYLSSRHLFQLKERK